MLHYRQTEGGDYNSRPRLKDVLAELEENNDWFAKYQRRGHGEYIRNVIEFAEFFKEHRILDGRIQVFIDNAQEELV